MRDKAYLVGFLLASGFLLYLGRDLIQRSMVLAWSLTFGGTMTAAILLLLLYRFRLELAQSRHELARSEAELSFARKVQQALFPHHLPSTAGLEFSAVCIPARGISGDFYDLIQLPDGRLVFVIVDISGKGISAAILMANMHAFLRVMAGNGSSPGDVCAKLNQHLHEITETSRFATLFYAEWRAAEGRLLYVNAGHNPPLLVKGSSGTWLKMGGMPLGIFRNVQLETGEVFLQPGDLLALYSDGISEAGAHKDQELGEERLKNLITSIKDRPLAEIQESVLRVAREWSGGLVEDDMTLFMVRALAP